MSSVDNLVINRGSTKTDEANWENQTSREHVLSFYSLPCVLKIDYALVCVLVGLLQFVDSWLSSLSTG